MTVSRQIFLRMRNVLEKSCSDNQNTHFMFNTFFPKIPPLWDNVEEYDGYCGATNDVTRWHTRCVQEKQGYIHARMRMHKATGPSSHTHARTRRQICSTLCFPTVTVIRESASVLRYTYIAFLGYSVSESEEPSYDDQLVGTAGE
jgi:hypothetical protein